jgi:hypothetical protein
MSSRPPGRRDGRGSCNPVNAGRIRQHVAQQLHRRLHGRRVEFQRRVQPATFGRGGEDLLADVLAEQRL